jgi:hypothetical protein
MVLQYLTLVSMVIAAGALIVSTLTYRRNRRFENENHLYKTKTDVYQMLTRKAYELVSFYEDAYFEIKNAVENDNPVAVDVEKYGDEIDLKAYRFEKEAAFHSLLLPKKVLDSLEEFIDAVLYRNDPEGPVVDSMHDTLISVYEKVEFLVNDFRTDLNVEVLNESLFRRIK